MADVHDDPLREAGTAIVGICNELANVVMATQSLQLRLIGLKPDKDAPLDPDASVGAALDTIDLGAEQATARFAWQPALNDEWLAKANAVETAQAWAAAVPYAEQEPTAALAMERTEARLREIHPEAMDHYNSLRADGLHPAEAMRQAAPDFDTPSLQAGTHAPGSIAELATAQSATVTLAKDLGLDDLGPTLDRSTDPTMSAASPAAPAASRDATLSSRASRTRSFTDVEEETPDLVGDVSESASASTWGNGEPVSYAATEDRAPSISDGPDIDLTATADPTATAGPQFADPDADLTPGPDVDVPQMNPMAAPSEAAEAAQAAHQAFPTAREAIDRTPRPHTPAAQPQKRKVLSKVLRRGRR